MSSWNLGLLGAAAAPAGAYELIQTQNLSANATTVTFDAIPQTTYRHLQVRFVLLTTTDMLSVDLRLNGNTSSIYSSHALMGQSSSPTSSNWLNRTSAYVAGVQSGTNTTIPMAGFIDLLDFTSNSKTKVFRSLNGIARTGGSEIVLSSGLWNSTAAVTSLTLLTTGGAGIFATNSRFSLYGIKGS